MNKGSQGIKAQCKISLEVFYLSVDKLLFWLFTGFKLKGTAISHINKVSITGDQ
jgi:hypothetical protein